MPPQVPQASATTIPLPTMSYLVFAQATEIRADEAALVVKARAYFKAEIAFLERHYGDLAARYAIELEEKDGPKILLRAATRSASEDDWRAADAAEIAGRATGMATLARRCRVVWEIEEGDTRAVLTLAAMLAATYLGPILPPDHSTLYGVRGARERLEKLRGESRPA